MVIFPSIMLGIWFLLFLGMCWVLFNERTGFLMRRHIKANFDQVTVRTKIVPDIGLFSENNARRCRGLEPLPEKTECVFHVPVDDNHYITWRWPRRDKYPMSEWVTLYERKGQFPNNLHRDREDPRDKILSYMPLDRSRRFAAFIEEKSEMAMVQMKIGGKEDYGPLAGKIEDVW